MMNDHYYKNFIPDVSSEQGISTIKTYLRENNSINQQALTWIRKLIEESKKINFSKEEMDLAEKLANYAFEAGRIAMDPKSGLKYITRSIISSELLNSSGEIHLMIYRDLDGEIDNVIKAYSALWKSANKISQFKPVIGANTAKKAGDLGELVAREGPIPDDIPWFKKSYYAYDFGVGASIAAKNPQLELCLRKRAAKTAGKIYYLTDSEGWEKQENHQLKGIDKIKNSEAYKKSMNLK